MIRHMVAWKLAAEDAATHKEQSDKIIAGLRTLPALVPSIRALSIGPTVITGPNHWDLGFVVDFDDEAGLAAYQANPDHQAVGAYIRSVVAQQAVVDFEV